MTAEPRPNSAMFVISIIAEMTAAEKHAISHRARAARAMRPVLERHGLLERTAVRFRDDAHLMNVIQRIASKVGRRIDESSPMLDARLPVRQLVDEVAAVWRKESA